MVTDNADGDADMAIVNYEVFEVKEHELQRGYFHVVTDFNPHEIHLRNLGDALYSQTVEGFGDTISDAIESVIETLSGQGISGKLHRVR
jgi:hypothetical protein